VKSIDFHFRIFPVMVRRLSAVVSSRFAAFIFPGEFLPIVDNRASFPVKLVMTPVFRALLEWCGRRIAGDASMPWRCELRVSKLN